MSARMVLVDAFVRGPFSGNPAAVCLPEAPVDADWMQAVAAEMNQAETAFLVRPRAAEGSDWGLRWFTPTVEVDLCGHATLAAAHVLWSDGLVPRTAALRFHTRSGVLVATTRGEQVVLDFPAVPMVACAPPKGLLEALGVQPLSVFRAGPDYVIETLTVADVEEARPDLLQLASIPCRGVGLTAKAEVEFDVVSRFFAPASGIPEDAATGSLHCALGPFWSKRLRKPVLRCHQASRRGGLLEVEPLGARVALAGRATTVLDGRWR
ncbi:MAG TPA: PhzF family phenazine biosynthesis protein [Planctomycetota bacterium]|nr:PhzF family phenazine biosynthesis protein [Planctomycetota bacterium]